MPLSSLNDARTQIPAQAEPGEPIAVSLGEALGLTLAEPVVADIDHPPSDRAHRDGYAVRSADLAPGTWLRVASPFEEDDEEAPTVEPGEAVRVRSGDPLPEGADLVLPRRDVRAEPGSRLVEVRRAGASGSGTTARGSILSAGTTITEAGTRVDPPLVALLASQGTVHPLCHRRVRVAVITVGDHWISPADEPSLHRERNPTNAALVGLLTDLAAMPHDLQAVGADRLLPALERSLLAPVILVCGPFDRLTRRAFAALPVEFTTRGVRVRPGGRVRHGAIRDDLGRATNHVFHLPSNPVAATIAFALFVRPLIERIQGRPATEGGRTMPAVWDGRHPATPVDRCAAPLVRLDVGPDARMVARPVQPRGLDDLPALAEASGVAVLPAGSGPWESGDIVDVLPLGRSVHRS